MSAPPSPPALRRSRPAWLNLRLLAGVLLVLVSVAVGARVVGSADRTVRVWSVTSDLAAGTALTSADVVPVRVRLLAAAGRYLTADPVDGSPSTIVGRTLSRPVGAGELLPRTAVTMRACGDEISIPVGPRHIPASVRHGSRVAVFATGRQADGSATQETGMVLADVAVQSVTKPSSGLVSTAGDWAVVVRVEDALALDVVRSVRTADIDVVLVRSSSFGGADGDGCGSAGTPPARPGESAVTPGGPAAPDETKEPVTPAPAPRAPTSESTQEGQSLSVPANRAGPANKDAAP
jgi:hypothetical protein